MNLDEMEFPPSTAGFRLDLEEFPKSSLDTDDGIQTAYGDLERNSALENLEINHLVAQQRARDNRIASSLGMQEVLKKNIECNMCASSTRLPGIKSSCLSLEVLMDKLDSLESFEYLNTEKPRNEFGPSGIHGLVESKFNI